MIRIISGQFKGRRLQAPQKLPVRPTTDRAKEALFNILCQQYDFESINFLDLFSGTGNLSYECASRGVKDILAVDDHSQCIKFIADTTQQLNLQAIVRPIKSDVFSFLKKTTKQFDLIFADPPYNIDSELLNDIIVLTFQRNILLPHGTLVVEHAKTQDLSSSPFFREKRTYGHVNFSFFENT